MITGRPSVDPRPVSRSVYEIKYETRNALGGLWGFLKAVCVGGVVVLVAIAYMATH